MNVSDNIQTVRVLLNKGSGVSWSLESMIKAFSRYWDINGKDLSYQFTRNAEDGYKKAQRAVEQGIDVLIVVGGDGTINTTASALIGSDTVMGAIPTGSGNGFARHFGIPLKPEDAIKALAAGRSIAIDVGMVNDQPFLVTCSMAWDAAIVRTFDKSPIRGILPYVFAGVYEFFEYESQPMTVIFDTGEVLEISDPLVLTVANLTQYGGGAIIAPKAAADDGMLDLVVALQQDAPALLSNINKVFNGSINQIPQVIHRRFSKITIQREHASPIQMDGELVDAASSLTVAVKALCLKVLIPAYSDVS